MSRILFGLLILGLLSACEPAKTEVPIDSPEFAAVVKTLEGGPWAWESMSCSEDARTFTFDISKRAMYLHAKTEEGKDSTWTYRILKTWDNGLQGRILGEKRMTRDGKPVHWNLILRNNHTYYWELANARSFRASEYVLRCE